uniref:Putative secreted protein n=1 Tax=Panstrongylus lignarius TaxID=156445 RepID=A0A224XND1_9HEMI
MSLRLWFGMSLVNFGNCLLMKCLACICPSVLSHHYRRCSSIQPLVAVCIRRLDNPQKGSGPIKVSFAKASAFSLPRVHASVSLFRTPILVRAVRQSHINFESIWCEGSAFKAAWLSEYIATLFLSNPCLKISLAQRCNATTSA